MSLGKRGESPEAARDGDAPAAKRVKDEAPRFQGNPPPVVEPLSASTATPAAAAPRDDPAGGSQKQDAGAAKDSGSYSPIDVDYIICHLNMPDGAEVSRKHSISHTAGKQVHAYAKLASRNWAYYSQQLQIVIGRHAAESSDQIDIDLGPSKIVSRRHAIIHYNLRERQWEMSVLGRNGVRLDGNLLKLGATMPLRSGHVIEVGNCQMMFVLPGVEPHVAPEFVEKAREARIRALESSVKGEGARDDTTAAEAGASSYPRGVAIVSRPQVAATQSGLEQDLGSDNCRDIKPPFSYATMISQAILSTEEHMMSLADIYAWISTHYAFYRYSRPGWQNSIRHNLSLNKAFEKVARKEHEPGKGSKWHIVPEYKDELLRKALTGKQFKSRAVSPRRSPSRDVQLRHNQPGLESLEHMHNNLQPPHGMSGMPGMPGMSPGSQYGQPVFPGMQMMTGQPLHASAGVGSQQQQQQSQQSQQQQPQQSQHQQSSHQQQQQSSQPGFPMQMQFPGLNGASFPMQFGYMPPFGMPYMAPGQPGQTPMMPMMPPMGPGGSPQVPFQTAGELQQQPFDHSIQQSQPSPVVPHPQQPPPPQQQQPPQVQAQPQAHAQQSQSQPQTGAGERISSPSGDRFKEQNPPNSQAIAQSPSLPGPDQASSAGGETKPPAPATTEFTHDSSQTVKAEGDPASNASQYAHKTEDGDAPLVGSETPAREARQAAEENPSRTPTDGSGVRLPPPNGSSAPESSPAMWKYTYLDSTPYNPNATNGDRARGTSDDESRRGSIGGEQSRAKMELKADAAAPLPGSPPGSSPPDRGIKSVRSPPASGDATAEKVGG